MMHAQDILNGRYDDELDAIEVAVKSRKRSLAQIRAASLKEGDTVVVTEGIRPKYFVGARATLVSKGEDRATVRLESERLRQRGARYVNPLDGTVTLPSALIRKVE